MQWKAPGLSSESRGALVLKAKLLRLMLALGLASSVSAATFGTVVELTGHISDIALDARRGVVYAANFTANRIEVVSTSDLTVRDPYNVPAQPGAGVDHVGDVFGERK